MGPLSEETAIGMIVGLGVEIANSWSRYLEFADYLAGALLDSPHTYEVNTLIWPSVSFWPWAGI